MTPDSGLLFRLPCILWLSTGWSYPLHTWVITCETTRNSWVTNCLPW